MKFGIFFEHQLPRPWHAQSEYQLLQQSLDQIELADRLGFDFAWEVEHHLLEEYSHSSAPEVFLGAASQRTKRIRLGHGVIQLPTNRPAHAWVAAYYNGYTKRLAPLAGYATNPNIAVVSGSWPGAVRGRGHARVRRA